MNQMLVRPRPSNLARRTAPFLVSARTLLRLLFVGFWALIPASSQAQPNILILLADDLGYADVGFNGGTAVATPNLDRLAATGVNLTDFRACPMCSPTRAGLLTGRWPARLGLMRAVIPPWSDYGLPVGEKLLPERLAPLGYERRGIMGKWHLGHARRAFLPPARGFTHFTGCYNGAIDYFTHERDGECDWHHGDRTVREEGYATDLIAAAAVRFIHESPNGKPWFLYVPFNAPHSPFQAKPADLEKYAQLRPANRRAYAAMVDSMDQAIGRILAAVEARGDATNTLILFSSDNGGVPRVGNNGRYRGGKLSVYEGGTRVCAILRWPAGGVQGGKQFEGRIGYIDVVPTLLAAAGAAIPSDLDGVNFIPSIQGGSALRERPWFSYVHQGDDAHASVHLGRWKLVAHGDFFSEQPSTPSGLELYDLSADPGEKQDLAAAHPERVAELHRRLREFGTWRKPGVGPYAEGRAGFKAPKDWQIREP